LRKIEAALGRPVTKSERGQMIRTGQMPAELSRSRTSVPPPRSQTDVSVNVGTRTLADACAGPTWQRVIRAQPRRVSKGAMTTECTVTPESGGEQRSPLASGSVREHLFRGAVGLTAAILAIVLVAVVGPISLVLLLVTVFAWRGCPTCWTVGLLGTLADNHARQACSRC
jgi:hypothetical protein